MQNGVEITEPLHHRQPASEQRVVEPQDLRHPPCPAHSLPHVQRQPFGRQTRRQRHAQIGGFPTAPLQLERRVCVFGDGLDRKSADLFQRRAADHRTGAAEERGIPVVVALLDQTVEQLVLAGHLMAHAQIALERIRGIEMVRRLDQSQVVVDEETACRHLQKAASRDMITVEDADQLTLGQRHGVVEIAGLGVMIVFPGDVAHPGGSGERGKRIPPTVVQQIDPQLVTRVIQVLRRQHRVLDDLQALVVGRDIDIHARPCRRIRRQWHHLALQRPDILDIAEDQNQPGIELRRKQTIAQHRFQTALEHQRFCGAPIQVAGRDRRREQDQEDSDRLGTRPEPKQHQHRHDRDQAEHPLMRNRHRRGHGQQDDRQGNQQQDCRDQQGQPRVVRPR